jgi:hypothetical protein
MTFVPHPPYFLLFPQLEMKLKGRHFDTIEVIKAEVKQWPVGLKLVFEQTIATVPEIMDVYGV